MSDVRDNGPLDRLMAEHREALDREIARSGAPERIRDKVLMRRSLDPLAGMHWQRIAAAVLVAGMLGGAVDLLLPDRGGDAGDATIVGALYDIDQSGGP